METSVVQRWRDRRGSYRPAGEPIDTRRYEVAELAERDAKAFVEQHHYSGSYPAARFRFGLYRGAACVGAAIFSEPVNAAVLSWMPCGKGTSSELGRFVLVDDVEANGETWFLQRCFELLAREHGQAGVVSHADPVRRRDAAGRLITPGHVGTIYQASNAAYLGRATPRTLHLLPDGTVFSARAQQKIRGRERGWRYAAAQLVAAAELLGAAAAPLGEDEDARAWLRLWMPRVTRPLRHPGNHRYAWLLGRARRRTATLATSSLPYPKFVEPEQLPLTTGAS